MEVKEKMESNFKTGEAEFYKKTRKESSINKNLLNANIKLQDENKELKEKIKKAIEYVDKMSYADIVNNPKKDLIKILKKEK